MSRPFPLDISFVQEGRRIEGESLDSGRRSNQITVPVGGDGPFDGMPPEYDIQETEERVATLKQYVPYAQEAFRDRGLLYPFEISADENSLRPIAGRLDLARQCAELSNLVGKNNAGDHLAKGFERRAVKALHRFLGGWAVSVGAPRDDGSGPRAAVQRLREMLGSDSGEYAPQYPNSGDLGADAIWILGKEWGGPVVFLQAKNSAFAIRDVPQEFLRPHDIIHHWFGRRMDSRALVNVYAVNTILTKELKETAFRSGPGVHVLDAADILTAENLPEGYQAGRDVLTLM